MKTRARRKDGDDWILNGTKMWITNAPFADVAVVWAKIDDGGADSDSRLLGRARHARLRNADHSRQDEPALQ
ncbi:MAG: acyl-CoA dehydrogenase family protein [Mesorhizobium sp.]